MILVRLASMEVAISYSANRCSCLTRPTGFVHDLHTLLSLGFVDTRPCDLLQKIEPLGLFLIRDCCDLRNCDGRSASRTLLRGAEAAFD